MSEAHLPSLVLEEIVTGARDRSEPHAASHLAECNACREALAQLEADTEAYLQRRPPAVFAARVAARHREQTTRSQRWTWTVGGALAAAACVAALLWVVVLRPAEHRLSEEVRLRGGAAVQTLTVRAGTLVPVPSEAQLPAGIQLRFRIQTRRAHLCVYHRCGADLTLLHPLGLALPAPPGPWLMPGTFALTATPARDYLVVALLRGPSDCRVVEERVRRRLAAGPGTDLAAKDPELVIAPLPRVQPNRGHP